MTGIELLVGVAYVALLVREWRHLRHNPHHRERVAWLEIAAAGILALEGYHIWHRHHEEALRRGTHAFHVLPWLYFALAGFYIWLAFGMARLDARRFLHLYSDGFAVRLKPFGKVLRFPWSEVVDIEKVGFDDVKVKRNNGQTDRISFAQMHDGPAHRDRLLIHAAQAGKQVNPAN